MFAEKKGGANRFKYELSDTYQSMEERYDYACEYYRKRNVKLGLDIPKKYNFFEGKYLQWESTSEIGESYKGLKRIYKNRKISLKKNKTQIVSEERKRWQKKIKKTRSSIRKRGINWEYIERKDDWFGLKEPKSSKKVKIRLDFNRESIHSLSMNSLVEALKILAKIWNRPFDPSAFDPSAFNRGTLTDCEWHADLDKKKRENALDLAVAIWGAPHIRAVLKVLQNLSWALKYINELKEDLKYVSIKRKAVIRESRNYDRILYLKV